MGKLPILFCLRMNDPTKGIGKFNSKGQLFKDPAIHVPKFQHPEGMILFIFSGFQNVLTHPFGKTSKQMTNSSIKKRPINT